MLLCVMQNQERFANSFEVVCLRHFFLSMIGWKIIDLFGNVRMTVDIPWGTKFERTPFISNSWVRAEVRHKLLESKTLILIYSHSTYFDNKNVVGNLVAAIPDVL